MLLKTEKLVHHVVQEFLWPNIGIDIIVDYATQLSRWMHKLSKRTNKLWKKRKQLCKPKRKLKINKLPIKLQLEKVKKTPKKLVKRNDFVRKAYYIF
jgi:hypothetical protein